jgi:hypothetical protein
MQGPDIKLASLALVWFLSVLTLDTPPVLDTRRVWGRRGLDSLAPPSITHHLHHHLHVHNHGLLLHPLFSLVICSWPWLSLERSPEVVCSNKRQNFSLCSACTSTLPV